MTEHSTGGVVAPKPLMIVTPGELSVETKASVERAGYVVVETGFPERIQLIQPIVLPSSGDILGPALIKAVGDWSCAQDSLGKYVVAALKMAVATSAKPTTAHQDGNDDEANASPSATAAITRPTTPTLTTDKGNE